MTPVQPRGRHHIRNRVFVVSDGVLFTVATVLAFVLRFEGLTWPEPYQDVALIYLVAALPLKSFIYYASGLYRRLWRYAGAVELEHLAIAGAAMGTALFVLGAFLLPALGAIPVRVPLSVLVLDALLTIAASTGPRLAVRLASRRGNRGALRRSGKRVIIAGAGAAGEIIVKELLGHPQLGLAPIGFVDDDHSKHGQRMVDLPVLGAPGDLPRIVERYAIEEVVIAMPRASGTVIRRVVQAAQEAGIEARTMPGLFEILAGKVSVTSLRQVQIEDLLRREPIQTDLEQVRSLAAGETILVTGAGGSIGSELCRQLARLDPGELILLGHGENSIFDVQEELKQSYPRLRCRSVIADIRDRERMAEIFGRLRPFAVFHAAAHKHVPLMEANPAEAITNNVLGTKNVAELAAAHDTKYFVLISTDKAVRPTSLMGASKRVAEQIVQNIAEEEQKNFVAVRFGNVLGSRGSVVPTFLRQIRDGGPVTVTHPEMKRFFMTIPEAVQLVLQAGALGRGGEVFVLDMGEPVKVADLARDLIRLSGLEAGTDIEIRYSGARPGEKLYEELFFDAEHAEPTSHPKVLKAKNAALRDGTDRLVDHLIEAAVQGAPDTELRELLRRLVPDFSPELAVRPIAGARPTPEPMQRAAG